MDMETCYKILDILIAQTKDQKIKQMKVLRSELQSIFGYQENDVMSALDRLSSLSFVSLQKYKEYIVIRVEDRAFGYKAENKEKAETERRTNWYNRQWDLIQLGIGFVLGFISTALGYWFFTPK